MLLVSILAGDRGPCQDAVRRLAELFGPLADLSAPLPFGFSDYYQAEMGSVLFRRLAAFANLVATHELAAAKRSCLRLEAEMSVEGRRRVNLDPSLLTGGGLVLATGKYRGHRVTLEPGIYAELTLHYHRGALRPLAWTYPDYASEPLSGHLLTLRRRYLWQLKQEQGKEQPDA